MMQQQQQMQPGQYPNQPGQMQPGQPMMMQPGMQQPMMMQPGMQQPGQVAMGQPVTAQGVPMQPVNNQIAPTDAPKAVWKQQTWNTSPIHTVGESIKWNAYCYSQRSK